MVFSSLLFLFYFLPIVLILYFIVARKYRNAILLSASLIFYAWGEPTYIWLMLYSVILDYTSGRNIHKAQINENPAKAKFWLIVSIVGNIGLLGFFKYSNFFIENINFLTNMNLTLLNISLPIGISFYTFQTMSYSIDIYRNESKVQKSIVNFATYVTLFPQLIAGPIVRYQTIAEEIDTRTETESMIAEGISRFIIGLAKKVLLANTIGQVWHMISTQQIEMSLLGSWLGIICYAFQIYFDFSGYSDMAIGLGKIFGFNFLENFNYPYMAQSITDFWRRWHISLSTWFKEYVYIPLGGNRKHQLRNIFMVWLLTGIWHGASWNFVLWGLYFALLLIIEKLFLLNWLNKQPKLIGHIYTLFFILVSWALFAFDSMSQSLQFLKTMFSLREAPLINTELLYLISNNIILILILIIASTNIPKKIYQSLKLKPVYENIYLMMIFLISITYLVNSSYNPFLYFKF